MKLFLCEKPSQAKDIGKVLGVLAGRHDGYYLKDGVAVTWCFGHILANAMPEAYGEQYAKFSNIAALPLLPDRWLMEVPKSVAKQFKIIRELLAKAEEVVIATDADREGEVIGRELLEYCGYHKKVSRFWTSGLDPASVKKALGKIMPGEKTESLYQAGLARSRADWLVGMNLSRAYTVAYAEGYGKEHTLSIGRIQTPTLNLVVRRDALIDEFVAYPHYGLIGTFQTADQKRFQAVWQIPESLKNHDGLCVDKAVVADLAQRLPGSIGKVSVKVERKKTPAPLPYSLSALQKEAGRRFGLSPKKTLEIAQALYEKYKITSYPRTPCQYLPASQQAEVPAVLAALVKMDPTLDQIISKADGGRDSRVWNDTQVNKHSHHAIIPTTVCTVDLSILSKAERDIYHLIRNRYIALFYPDYEYDATVIVVTVCDHLFKATGQTPLVVGWKALLGHHQEEEADAENHSLPAVQDGSSVSTVEAQLEQKKTAPPARFTESSLLDEMCTLSDFLKTVDDDRIKKILRSTEGLGTEATRGAIIERLFEMNYIEKRKGKIFATDKGKRLIQRIPPMVADPVTTAKWELALAGIEAGQVTLDEFLAVQGSLITELVNQAQADAAQRSPGAGGRA